jgi:type II secretory pathway component PulC
MGQLGIRIINVVLFTASCFFTAGVFNHVADSQLAPDYVAAFAPVARPEVQPPSWEERSEILERNLFGAEVGLAAAIPEVAPVEEPEEEAQATKLPIELLGTLAGEPASLSTAVINNTRKKKHQVVRIGDTLKEFEYVVVTAIEPRRVLLKNRDVIEELLLSKVGTIPKAALSSGRRPPRSDALDRMRERKDRTKARRARSRESRRRGKSKPDEDMEEQLRRMQGTMTQDLIRDLEPSFDEQGEINGVLVGNIANDALLAQAGLEASDIIVSLNGTKIDSAGAAARVLRDLARCQPMTGVAIGPSGEKEINVTHAMLAQLDCPN